MLLLVCLALLAFVFFFLALPFHFGLMAATFAGGFFASFLLAFFFQPFLSPLFFTLCRVVFFGVGASSIVKHGSVPVVLVTVAASTVEVAACITPCVGFSKVAHALFHSPAAAIRFRFRAASMFSWTQRWQAGHSAIQ